ncbi:MmcQ/YjbR family DNA-binding protein [Paenibacillus sp. TC-CSREp1]|uniref:MmcQ/YjbR family DNA-binding protein n=1 Tax=Paenibacillus sp. TC-CSREp1 TaxID=3410089 RepID=UPI003CE72D7E
MIETMMSYCLAKKGAVKEYPFGPDAAVIKVADKMFALLFEGNGEDSRINLKCDPIIAENLREQHEAVKPGYHMNKKHWNTVMLDDSLPNGDIYAMIDHSYNLVVQKLPKRVQETLSE